MNAAEKLREYEDSLDAETLKQKAVENWYLGAVAAIVLAAFYLRYAPAKGMQYLQAADPYMIFRMSQHLALEGNLPQLDFLRYFPYAAPTYLLNNGDFIIPALLYNAGFSLLFPSYLEWAQFYPAMLGALSVLLMYFLGKELFDRRTGLAAAFFLAVTSAALRRTSAGFFEKEPIGTFMMMASLLFFTRAWKRESWINGIISGITLGLFTISWGGSQMLWLLYPIVTGIVLFINEDIRSLITAYTPTVIIGGFFAAIVNYSRFWFTDSLFFISLAVLGGLWLRYLVEELELVREDYLPYFIPSLSILGGIMAILSPLYSDWVARKILSVVQVAVGATGTDVIGQTVQENAPPGASSLMTNLGSVLSSGTGSGLDAVLLSASPWVLMVFAVPFIVTSLLLMLGRKYGLLSGKIPGRKYLAYAQAVFVSWMVFVAGLVQNMVFISALAAVVVAASLIVLVYFLDENSSFTISSLFLIGGVVGLGIFALRFSSGLTSPFAYLTLLPAVLAVAASVIVYYFESFPDREIEFRWYLAIPVVWIVSNVFGGTTRSRLVFLSSFAIALGAGYTFSKAVSKLRELDYSELGTGVDPGNLKYVVTALFIGLVLLTNGLSGFTTSQGITGSPSPQIWEQSLDYMEEDTPKGSVVLSWWDYGYYFETLGRRPAVADGGNAGYYTDETRAVNMPLADYLASPDRQEDRRFLEKHSVDYIWLDYSMIGKYSAVSQISNKNNSQFQVLRQFSTPGSVQNSISQDGNQTVAAFRGRLGGVSTIYAPLETSNTSMGIKGPATVRFSNGQTAGIGCVLTEDGRETYNVTQEQELDFCMAEDPFYTLERGATASGPARLVLVPEEVSDSTFVKLYIQDGYGLEYAEKLPEASNGYIKMWKVDYNQTQ
jgi:asparagine N-glycosylation enzyme membrane subunit Stt3